MARVILEMDVHCADCVKKIRKAVQNRPGVQSVWASREQGLVVITGTADAGWLSGRIERKLGRPVNILSDGAAPEAAGAQYWAPPQPQPRYGAPQYGGGWGMMPPQPYAAPQPAYPYAGNHHWMPPPRPRRHVSHGVPARHVDDEEGTEPLCSIQ